jgi:CrcB protein
MTQAGEFDFDLTGLTSSLLYKALMNIVLVGVGGALGAIARYLISGLVLHHYPGWKFPLPTFLVNVLGCLVAGILAGFIVKQDWFSAQHRLFLFTGILGGFTTFSAFGLETMHLLRDGHIGIAMLYVGLSVVVGIGALWVAMLVAGRL